MSKVIGLFPTPLMVANSAIDRDLVNVLAERACEKANEGNARSDLLSHTEMVEPESESMFMAVVEKVMPEVRRFGVLLFGDDLDWTIKEMWLNVLDHGGSQFLHSHANSFMSGIIYLSESDPSSRTMFQRHAGAGEYVFKHDGREGMNNDFTSDRWVIPEVNPGDMALYPSHLLHGVPPNQGGRRITLAFNAIPDHLKSFGYEIRFSR